MNVLHLRNKDRFTLLISLLIALNWNVLVNAQ